MALAQIMPTDTGVNEQIDWAAIDCRLGTRLPAECQSFLETYGAGGIGGVAHVLRPVPVPDSDYRPGSIADDTPGAQETRHHTPEHWRPEVDPDDIMIWRRTPGADVLCWVTTAATSTSGPSSSAAATPTPSASTRPAHRGASTGASGADWS
ncbi:hypothetical protein J7E91_33735 [Streptomyces sp. ISL-99]|uniref:SMI1/KNR4 family protein n=1 Tax=Streptomyces sp. ISL-99 TaxID=2819193 RepID=UPI001BE5CFF1|nr:SMI1/KNR4 family protein [Streptomyces sp. ISL-99]MBT2530184.1 hypothetical protein [Streptomyces sp. ISL-99]